MASPASPDFCIDVPELDSRSFIQIEADGRSYEALSKERWKALRRSTGALPARRRVGSIIINDLVHVLLECGPPKDDAHPLNVAQILTSRELQIACLVSEGKCDKIVARELGISENTVREHLRRVFHKLQISKRTSLVALVVRFRPSN